MKPVTLKLGEREFSMRLDMTSVSDLQEHANIDLLAGGKEAQARMQSGVGIGVVLWALAGGEDTGLSPREFGRLIGIEELPAAMSAIREVFARDAAPDEPASAGGGRGKRKAA